MQLGLLTEVNLETKLWTLSKEAKTIPLELRRRSSYRLQAREIKLQEDSFFFSSLLFQLGDGWLRSSATARSHIDLGVLPKQGVDRLFSNTCVSTSDYDHFACEVGYVVDVKFRFGRPALVVEHFDVGTR